MDTACVIYVDIMYMSLRYKHYVYVFTLNTLCLCIYVINIMYMYLCYKHYVYFFTLNTLCICIYVTYITVCGPLLTLCICLYVGMRIHTAEQLPQAFSEQQLPQAFSEQQSPCVVILNSSYHRRSVNSSLPVL